MIYIYYINFRRFRVEYALSYFVFLYFLLTSNKILPPLLSHSLLVLFFHIPPCLPFLIGWGRVWLRAGYYGSVSPVTYNWLRSYQGCSHGYFNHGSIQMSCCEKDTLVLSHQHILRNTLFLPYFVPPQGNSLWYVVPHTLLTVKMW